MGHLLSDLFRPTIRVPLRLVQAVTGLPDGG